MIFTMNQAELVWVCSCTTSFSPKNSDCREIRAMRSRPTWQMDGTTIARGLPFNQSLRYLLRDRDAIFGQDFRRQVRDMGIEEGLSTPHSPWQRAYVERVIGSFVVHNKRSFLWRSPLCGVRSDSAVAIDAGVCSNAT